MPLEPPDAPTNEVLPAGKESAGEREGQCLPERTELAHHVPSTHIGAPERRCRGEL